MSKPAVELAESDRVAFVVTVECMNCGMRDENQFPTRTVVRQSRQGTGIEAVNVDCEELGLARCDCCEMLDCPTCGLQKHIEVVERTPVDSQGKSGYTDRFMRSGVTSIAGMTSLSRLQGQEGQDPALDAFYEDVVEEGHETEIANPQRGCGHLKHNAAYVRSDVQALSSPDGDIPRFVALDNPIEYREHASRGAIIPGYKPFPGIQFALAYLNSGHTTTPEGEIDAHLDVLRTDELAGDHYGELTTAHAHDLLMSVGESHWETPGEYIEECREHGLNLRIPASTSKKPPVINPLRTRCWVVHPAAVDGDRAGIIGYAVLTRTIYTAGTASTADDPDIPAYAQEWAETGRIDLVTPDDPEHDESPDTDIEAFAGDVEADPDADPDADATAQDDGGENE